MARTMHIRLLGCLLVILCLLGAQSECATSPIQAVTNRSQSLIESAQTKFAAHLSGSAKMQDIYKMFGVSQLELSYLFSSIHSGRMTVKSSPLASAFKRLSAKAANIRAQSIASDPSDALTDYEDDTPIQKNMMNGFLKQTANSRAIDELATTGLEVSRVLINNSKLKKDKSALRKLSAIKAPPRFCPFKKAIACDPTYPYRTLDGSCNNLRKVWWGKAEAPFKRYLEPDYADLVSEPRASVDGGELPNARDIACALHTETYEIEPFVTNMFLQWSQMVNHDVTSLAIVMDDERDSSTCNSCTPSAKCLPIMINANGSVGMCVSMMSHRCIEFTRSSASFVDTACSLGRREQLNLQTPYIDASAVYSTSVESLEKLRDRRVGSGKGLMLTQDGDLLPQDPTEEPSDCLDFSAKQRCFRAGDDRVNQNPALMSIQTLMVREHNRIARQLARVNTHWDDETVFQETRRIVAALMQHVTFNEYVPLLLGPTILKIYGLAAENGSNYFTGYDETVDPRLANEWSAAAGRFGHSMIRGQYSLVDNKFDASSPPFMLRNNYFRANQLYNKCQGGMEAIVRGLLKDPIMKIDRHFSTDVSQHLFETTDDFGRPFHFDLVAINIQRGRDHGLPAYVKFREFCGLPPVKTWTEMRSVMSDEAVDAFKQLYRFVDDVDLFSALVSEFRLKDSMVGPTLACLLATQFRDMKHGDRFWYETNAVPVRFTPGQLNELRKMTLSKVLCRNLEDTPHVQAHTFISFKMKGNPLVNCTTLADFDWTFWKA